MPEPIRPRTSDQLKPIRPQSLSPSSNGTVDPEPIRVKICGLTRDVEAQSVASLGADWIGLNFHPPSPRSLDLDHAQAIVEALSESCRPVALFVDRPIAEILAVVERLAVQIIQLHGQEPPETLIGLAEYQIVRAYRLGSLKSVDGMCADLDRCRLLGRKPDAVLIDAHVPGQPGGTGQIVTNDVLDVLAKIQSELPPLILAGGLRLENLEQRLSRIRPWMVDVASGVESSPGRKDPERVKAFIAQVRRLSTDLDSSLA